MNEQTPQRPLRFRLNKQVVHELEIEELELVSGGGTAVCCLGCNTSGQKGQTICPTQP
jgi:hypothetical protein